MAEIKIEDLTVKFELDQHKGIITALDKVNTIFENGKFSVVVGQSGSGKSTLLRSIIGSILINGHIYFNGVDIEKLNIKERNISYVSQEFALYPNLTIFENIAFPLTNLDCSKDEIKSRVFEISNKLGLNLLLTRIPKQLSVGQKQCVALARALVKRSDIYLFDEPFSNLDANKSIELRTLIKQITSQYGATTIYVTHKLDDAYALADSVYILKEGKLVFKGTVDEIIDSEDENVKELFKAEQCIQ